MSLIRATLDKLAGVLACREEIEVHRSALDQFTLLDKRDAAEFEVGSIWSFGDGSGKPAGSVIVTAVSYEQGTFTVSS